MRKEKGLLLVGTLLAAMLVGCGSTDKEESYKDVENSIDVNNTIMEEENGVETDNTEFSKFYIDGVEYSLNKTTVAEFLGDKWQIDLFRSDYELDSMIEENDSIELELESVDVMDIFSSIEIDITNMTESEMKVSDCIITSIRVDEDVKDVELVNGVTFGMTYEEIEQLYGAAESEGETDTFYVDENGSTKIIYYEWTKGNIFYSLKFKENELYEIDLSVLND